MHIARETTMDDMMNSSTEAIPVMSRWFGSWQISLQRKALSNEELAQRYNKYAKKWSRILQSLDYPDSYEQLFRVMQNKNILHKDKDSLRVLDNGTGTGELSLALARVYKQKIELDAIDISECMLEQASLRLQNIGLATNLKQGDARELPYSNGAFDLCMTAHMIEHFAEPTYALKEMMRVTKPGGYVMICVSKESLLGGYVQLKWRTHLVTVTKVKNWLYECGLQEVQCLSADSTRAFQQLSIACLARKPF